MTTQEKELILALATHRIDRAVFDRKYPVNVAETPGHVTQLLTSACTNKNGEDVEHALLLGFIVGFPADSVSVLCDLLAEDWHERHEDIASILQEKRDPASSEALFAATQRRYEYLDYNDSAALAVKCVWALGALGGADIARKLRKVADSDGREDVRQAARENLYRVT